MSLSAGLVGVVPAIEKLLDPSEDGPIRLSTGSLIVWSLGLAFFGVIFSVPLRKQVIIKEKLRFQSGTATAAMISVLHNREAKLKSTTGLSDYSAVSHDEDDNGNSQETLGRDESTPTIYGWQSHARVLSSAFGISASYVGMRDLSEISGPKSDSRYVHLDCCHLLSSYLARSTNFWQGSSTNLAMDVCV